MRLIVVWFVKYIQTIFLHVYISILKNTSFDVEQLFDAHI